MLTRKLLLQLIHHSVLLRTCFKTKKHFSSGPRNQIQHVHYETCISVHQFIWVGKGRGGHRARRLPQALLWAVCADIPLQMARGANFSC